MNKECPACNQDPCVCDDICDSCGSQMVGLISTKKLMKQVPRYATGDEVISGADVENQISILDRLIPALKEGSYMLPGTGDVMSAMDSVEAAKAAMKAERLRDQLKLSYNKARQAAITNEILEIVGGAEALKG